MPVNEKIILAIEWERTKRRWSKIQAAKAIGMTRAAYSKLVNGQTKDVHLGTLEQIAEGFGCELEVLFKEIPKND